MDSAALIDDGHGMEGSKVIMERVRPSRARSRRQR
jgi:hypothetical protein